MASIYKRGGEKNKNGPYYITYFATSDVRKTVKGCNDYAATEAYARKLEADAFLRKNGVIDARADRYAVAEAKPLVVKNNEGKVVGGHVADFHKNIIARGSTEGHAAERRASVCRIIELTSSRQISDLTPAKVQSAVHELRQKGLSCRTCNQHLGAIKQFSRWLWSDGRAPEYTLAHLAAFNEAVDRRHQRRALSPEELVQLIEAAENGATSYGFTGRERAMLYRIATGTGFRRNEIRSLTRESFDLDADPPTVTVEAAYSKHRRRDVQPIRRDLANTLRVWLAFKKPGEPLFDVPEWQWHRTSLMIYDDLKAAEIAEKDERGRYADFHALRHTYITNIGRLPVALKIHQDLARHSEPSLTMRYTHAALEDKVKALDALPPVNPNDAAINKNTAAG